MRTLIALLGGLLLLVGVFPLVAQGEGQFCVRAFEDRNGNGTRDEGEPAITRGIAAILSDANNVIRDSAVMEDSATAGRGVLCFLGLENQQYTMLITSADFEATTSDSLIVNLVAGEEPPVLDYGGQRILAEAPIEPVDTANANRDELIERAVVAGSVALVVMFIMSFIGLLIVAVLRRRRRPAYPQQYPPDAMYRPPPRSTGQMPPVPPQDTGRYPRQD